MTNTILNGPALALIFGTLLVLANLVVQENTAYVILQKRIKLLKNELAAVKAREKEHSGDLILISKLEKERARLEIENSTAAVADKERAAELEEQVLLLKQEIESGSYLLDREDKNHDHLNTPPSTTFEAEQNTEKCVRLSTQAMGHAKFRTVVYQKHGGQQLIDFITHYLQALTYDEIVVVANEDGNILEDTPLYNELISKGVHLWQCIGTHADKGNLWTQVLKQYKDTSDFIQPADVDEYLALVSPTNETSLLWDRTSLHTALDELPLSDGKPYKTIDSKPVPRDCKNALENPNPLDLADTKYQARHCTVSGFTVPEISCHNKVFFRGSEFTETDTGNHFGSTDFLKACTEEGLEAGFQPTNFVLINYQALDFKDWLIRALRMATEENFNRFDIDKCPEGHDQKWHECVIFGEMVALNFNLYDIRALYQQRMCNVGAHFDVAGVTKICTS